MRKNTIVDSIHRLDHIRGLIYRQQDIAQGIGERRLHFDARARMVLWSETRLSISDVEHAKASYCAKMGATRL